MAERTQAVFEALAAAGRCLTVDDLVAVTSLSRRVAAKSAGLLIYRGFAEREKAGCYRLTAEGRKAHELGAKIKSGPFRAHTRPCRIVRKTLRERAWSALRTLKKATIRDLLVISAKGTEKCAAGNVGRYLHALEGAGIVARLPHRVPGTAPTSNGAVRYVLAKDVGPEAPVLRPHASAVYDPNAREYLPIERVQP